MKVKMWFAGTLVFLFLTLLFLTSSGSMPIGMMDILGSLNPLGPETLSDAEQIVLKEVRLPRMFLALVAGAALAVAGACQQAVFRNPLADPYVLGLTGGASLCAALAICWGFPQYISISAFAGGMMAIFLVEKVSSCFGKGDKSITHLLLAGMALSAFSSALLSTVMAIYSQQMQTIFFWVMGSVAQPPENLMLMSSLILAGLLGIMYFHKELDIMTLGETQAFYLGIPVKELRRILLFLSAFIVSLSVSMTGAIGFIGLITPHLLRNWFTSSHRYLLPLSALWGGILLVWSDGLIRLVDVFATLPIGAVTALFGSPFFLYILIRKGRSL